MMNIHIKSLSSVQSPIRNWPLVWLLLLSFLFIKSMGLTAVGSGLYKVYQRASGKTCPFPFSNTKCYHVLNMTVTRIVKDTVSNATFLNLYFTWYWYERITIIVNIISFGFCRVCWGFMWSGSLFVVEQNCWILCWNFLTNLSGLGTE